MDLEEWVLVVVGGHHLGREVLVIVLSLYESSIAAWSSSHAVLPAAVPELGFVGIVEWENVG